MKIKFNHETGAYIEQDGAKIYFEEIGDVTKPALLMLHGGFENIESLNVICSYLADKFRIIGVDTRGHGKSTLGNVPLTYKKNQNSVEAVLKHLGIDRTSIIGFSDGAIIGCRIASSKNIIVEKFVAIGVTWSVDDVLSNMAVNIRLAKKDLRKLFEQDYKAYERLNPEANFDEFKDHVFKMWIDLEESGHPKDSVNNIEAETLLIRGDKDFFVSLDSFIKLSERIKNSAILNVPFAKHLVHVEQKELCEMTIKQFLA